MPVSLSAIEKRKEGEEKGRVEVKAKMRRHKIEWKAVDLKRIYLDCELHLNGVEELNLMHRSDGELEGELSFVGLWELF